MLQSSTYKTLWGQLKPEPSSSPILWSLGVAWSHLQAKPAKHVFYLPGQLAKLLLQRAYQNKALSWVTCGTVIFAGHSLRDFIRPLAGFWVSLCWAAGGSRFPPNSICAAPLLSVLFIGLSVGIKKRLRTTVGQVAVAVLFPDWTQVLVFLHDMLINLCFSLPTKEGWQKQPIGLQDIMSPVTSGCLQGVLNPEEHVSSHFTS